MGTIENYGDSVEPQVQQNRPATTTSESSIEEQNDSHFQPQTSLQDSDEPVDEHIRFGSYIALQHKTTSRYLSSRSPSNEINATSTNGNKDQVCLFEN